MAVNRIILLDVEPGDFILAVRTAEHLLSRFEKDCFLVFGEGKQVRSFYGKRNKSSITVRPGSVPAHMKTER